MNYLIRMLCCAAAVGLMSGCATSLDKKAAAVDWSKGSVVVMSVEMTNEYRPRYTASALGVTLKKMSSKDTRDYIPAFSQAPDEKNIFLVTQQIQPGKYAITNLYGFSRQFPVVGQINFEVDAPIEVAPNSVIYLGRISAINKEKSDIDDQSAGPIIPLIDQAVTGFATSTLKLSLTDQYAEDVEALRRDYASMQTIEVLRNPLKTISVQRSFGSKAAQIVVNSQPEKPLTKQTTNEVATSQGTPAAK
jgi:hypothetical protein